MEPDCGSPPTWEGTPLAFKRDSYNRSFSTHHTSGSFSIPGIWSTFKGELLFVVALVVALLLGGYTHHPGLHVAGATVLVDLLVWRRLRRLTLPLAVLVVLMNVIALVVILVGNDPAELWLSGAYGLYAIFLLLVRR